LIQLTIADIAECARAIYVQLSVGYIWFHCWNLYSRSWKEYARWLKRNLKWLWQAVVVCVRHKAHQSKV